MSVSLTTRRLAAAVALGGLVIGAGRSSAACGYLEDVWALTVADGVRDIVARNALSIVCCKKGRSRSDNAYLGT